MERVKITQVKSMIDRPQRQKDTLKALGLGKIQKSSVHNLTPQIKGMVSKVSHLIVVEEVENNN